ncbi:MAG: leucyl aminopeptidase [Bdellovibrionales bacterium]
MEITLKKGWKSAHQTLVLLALKDNKSGKPNFGKLPASIKTWVEAAAAEAHFQGDRRETAYFRRADLEGFKNVLLVGLGTGLLADGETERGASTVILGALKAAKAGSAAIFVDLIGKSLQPLVEGFRLSLYEFREHKMTPKEKATKKEMAPTEVKELELLCTNGPNKDQQAALKRAEILSECQNFTRWLGDQPGNHMTPALLAEHTEKAAKGTGLKVTAWGPERIKKEKMGGLLAVARGSSEEPRFIVMEWNGGGKGKRPVVFVGKGLTFDSGGISIKPSASMEEMKYDMCGGAAVIGTMLALAKLKAKVNVIGLVPSTENMPGPHALKPGDIFFARNGKSVEVYNTDAEGRLILSDALVYGSELKPQAMFDAATLTGAILIALGNTHTGVFTRDKKLMDKIQKASDHTGELVWSMPLTDFHVEDMKGAHADLCNISGGRNAGSSTAAAFLEQFVAEGVPWAHFDVAGTAWNIANRFPYHPKKGASGIMVRTFVALAESFR